MATVQKDISINRSFIQTISYTSINLTIQLYKNEINLSFLIHM